ncbi:MAG: L,D-transpeptidase family protein [Rhizobiales bacterium]|nr:L,D-transpeptidase family protein [Hyphomicrobiales bacterium]
MRNLLLATSAAALVLALTGGAFADPDQQPPASATVVAPSTAPGQADTKADKPMAPPAGQAKPAGPAASPEQATAPQPSSEPTKEQASKLANPALSPADAAVAAQLKDLVESKLSQFVPREPDRAGIQAFYRDRGFAPLWLADAKPAPRIKQAEDFLHNVAADGLEPADYATPRFDDADPAKLAASELTLTNSVVTFSRHASTGRVAFSRISGAIYFDEKAPDPAKVLASLATSGDVRATLDSFNPQAPAYKALKAELAAARAGTDAEPEVATSEATPKKGTRHAANSKSPDARSKAAKIDTLIANMERWRWMPHDLGSAYVMVNIPDYTLKVVQNDKTVWHTKIVVGKVGTHATPLMTETMKYITVNPTWNVPPSIIRNEYLPALARDPDALSRIGLRISHNADGSIRIYQPPSERNALGRIRFNFPNRFLVYQHDTPDKNLFDKTTRAYSHGCMRVQNPDKYAEVLLNVSQPEDKYTAQRIRSMYGTSERTINFKKPIPVYLSYQTAFVDDAGKVQYRADIYGLDKAISGIMRGDRRVADVPVRRNYSSSSKPVMASSARTPRRDREYARDYDGGFQPFGWFGPQPNWRSAYQPRDRFGIW